MQTAVDGRRISAAVRTAEVLPPRDPEFDPPPRRPAGGPGRDVVHYYQRLLVNPFLSIIILLLALAGAEALRTTPLSTIPGSLVWAVGIAAVLTIQYHCLDCGATGWLRSWRGHACPRVVERWQTPFSAASHLFPTPKTQCVFWLIAFLVGGLIRAATAAR